MKKSRTSDSNGDIIKKPKDLSEVTYRMPRPNGLTALVTEARITQSEEAMANVKKFMINLWLMSNGTINGASMDIYDFARSIDVSVDEIRTRMRDNLLESKIWDTDKQQQIVEGMFGQMISWSMEDRMKINAQINLLMKSQGGAYKPFISAELNKALKMGLDSSTSFQSVVSKFLGNGSTTNILNVLHQENNEVTNQFVTTEDVLKILEDNGKELDKSEQAKLIEAKYDLSGLPEVVAVKQQGVDTSKEGLGDKIDVRAITKSTDNMQKALEAAEYDHHAMRREIEMRIDPDEPDPELTQYDEAEEIKEDDNSFSVENFLNQ